MKEFEDERARLNALIDEKMKEANAGLIPLEQRNTLVQQLVDDYAIKIGDPLLEKLADLILADDIAEKSRLKIHKKNAWLTDRQMERRLAGETEFREFT